MATKLQSDLESERIAVVKPQRINKELFEGKMKLLLEYTERRTMVELKAKFDECERQIQRTESTTKSALIQKQAELVSRKLAAEVEHNKLERLKAQIVACKIYAPLDGRVVFADTCKRWQASVGTGGHR